MMISANDVLQIISEIHQYSMLLIELRNETTLGIMRSANDRVSYFRVEGKLLGKVRMDLVGRLYAGETPESLHILTVDQLLQNIEGKTARHIWLESGGTSPREMAFLSIAELKSYFRTHARR